MLTTEQKTRMATGILSHLIGAYFLFGSLMCDCNAKDDDHYKQLLLHLKGVYWLMMKCKFGIQNPKLKTKELN